MWPCLCEYPGNNLGQIIEEQGRYDEADLLYRCALEGRRERIGVLSAEHPLARLKRPLQKRLCLVETAQVRENESEIVERASGASRPRRRSRMSKARLKSGSASE